MINYSFYNMKKLTINIPDEIHMKLKIKAAKEQTTITEIILSSLKI
jgi:hypothetical protein